MKGTKEIKKARDSELIAWKSQLTLQILDAGNLIERIKDELEIRQKGGR